MARSAQLRSQDWRAILQLVGECRELGDDRSAWREHLMAQVARLTGSDLGMTGEMAGCRSPHLRDLGVVTWGWQTGFVGRQVFEVHVEAFRHDPGYSPTMLKGFGLLAVEPAATFSRTDLMEDRPWYRSLEYQLIHKAYGVDHVLWCFHAIPCPAPDENVGLILCRAEGQRDFGGRDRAFVSEVVSALSPLVGGPLARFADPSPMDLAPRIRQVLACLLEGDGDKQVAKRLGMSVYTVNQYTKAIYRHFGVVSRAELLARWVRRGWGKQWAWWD
ncbi:helix-turn-helix transcriptional regulator [Tautonia sp. JC769]|uniref:helix-turn-helix transcriptional regulator n=1 Tax=Tautonia sp. JC769 TaxID=3232135 RepID=UPI0034584832